MRLNPQGLKLQGLGFGVQGLGFGVAVCAPLNQGTTPPSSTLCSGSDAGSYLRLVDFVYHSTLGLREIKKRRSLEH